MFHSKFLNKKIIAVIVGIIIIGGGSFYAGMKFDQSRRSSRAGQARAQQFGITGNPAGQGGQRTGAGFTVGEIIAKDEKSITIKLSNGGSKIIFFSDTTEVDKFAKGTAIDLEVGQTVTVNGQINQDGSVTAQTIQLRPGAPKQP